MIRTAAKLAVIFVLTAAGVHLGYRRLEEELRKVSCVAQQPADSGAAAPAAQETPEEDAVKAEDAPAPDAAALEDFQVIVRRNIFQTKQAAVPPPVTAQEAPPPTPPPTAPTALKLTLAGTVAGTDETARALIIDNMGKKEQQLLRVGDGVQGAIIKAIEWNSVTLDVNGRMEILKMPEVKPGTPLDPPAAGGMPGPPPPFQAGAPDMEAMRGMPPVRPNRRINNLQPPDFDADNPPEQEPPPEMPDIAEEQQMPPEEELSPELPPMDTE